MRKSGDHENPKINMDFSGAEPVTVEVTRGAIVESRHRGSVAVVDVQGQVQLAAGDITRPVYPRSAIKAFQALPLVETGAAEEFGFTPAEISLCCASHGGEAGHVKTVEAMLEKIGLGEEDLECGVHWPTHEESAFALAAAGQMPGQRHNNCSGKHAGMLALARKLGADTKGYTDITHPVQQRILGTMEAMCGVHLAEAPRERDGCSVPTWAIPLENAAYGFARFGAPDDLPEIRAQACRQIAAAVAEEPFMVAGSGRWCTDVMTVLGQRAFVKYGAEGVYCASLPEYGLGVAMKCEDGAKRGVEVMLAAVLRHIGVIEDKDLQQMAALKSVPLVNRRNFKVGEIRPAEGFLSF
ncbi:asparaginase [Aestuariispira insulae]|uniref:asparaginase n=1 Tax=Aestuariispira insulae TaxID=1461337 RepID=UPI001C3F516E|nr:asparaginase [Aestuariispira insulae]